MFTSDPVPDWTPPGDPAESGRARRPGPRCHRTDPVPKELLVGRAGRHLGRALLKRCPNCGAGRLFSRWVVMRRTCPRCHLIFDRGESDYFIGSFTVNFVTAELLIVAGAFAGIVATWPDVPWTALKWGLMATVLPVPFLFYPWAKTIWLAIDLTFRPPTLEDLDAHGENITDAELLPPVFHGGDSGAR